MLRLNIASRAYQDLIDIGEYTERQWGYEQRAKYLRQLLDRIKWLAENPHLGKPRPEIAAGDFSYREGKHQIFFYFYDDRQITIIGVLHERMDFESHF